MSAPTLTAPSRKGAASATARTAPNHDTLTCYTRYRCRRPECVARYNARNTERIHAQKAGTWNAFVDAEPVRRHILRLQAAGHTPTSIATAAGLDPRNIFDFIRPRPTQGLGRRQRTNPQLAAKILAVTGDASSIWLVDATGAIRRAQALIAIGWPKVTISLHAGLGNAYVSGLLTRTHIYASAAQAITKTYDELRSKRPEKHGVSQREAKSSRSTAAANGWPTPRYWDQFPDLLDDADFVPQVTRVEQVAYDAAWLLASGLNIDTVAERLGLTRGYIERALRKHPQGLHGAAA